MILSRKWANDYVDLTDIDNKTFCDEMTLSGSRGMKWKAATLRM